MLNPAPPTASTGPGKADNRVASEPGNNAVVAILETGQARLGQAEEPTTSRCREHGGRSVAKGIASSEVRPRRKRSFGWLIAGSGWRGF
jgi:hypothetical protein